MRRNAASNQGRLDKAGAIGAKPLAYLEAHLNDLPPALARAAIYVVENPEKVIRYSLKELSELCQSGEASIVRLCQAAGSEGFSEFKIALASELATRGMAEKSGAPRHVLQELADELGASITRTAEAIDMGQLKSVTKRLAKASRIDIFGSGVSGIIAELFSYRLLRAGLNAHAIRDITLAQEVANGLGDASAAIAISGSGITPNTVEFLKSARLAGAYTVAITCNASSPLARQAGAVLTMSKLGIPGYGGYINAVPRAVLIAEAIAGLIDAKSRDRGASE